METADPYEVLGVSRSATPREIRRAYRRRVVFCHRTGVLDLVRQLDELKSAYERTKHPSTVPRDRVDQPEQRTKHPSTVRPVPVPRVGAGDVLGRALKEISQQAEQLSAIATAKNEGVVHALAEEYDRRELADQKARALRRRISAGGSADRRGPPHRGCLSGSRAMRAT